MVPIAVINVIDCSDAEQMDIQSCYSYPDTPEGNRAAEATFREWVEETSDPEHPLTKRQITEAVKDGRFEIGAGYILLLRSSACGERSSR